MKKASLLLMITTVLSKIIGFLRESVAAAILGRTGPIAQAYTYAFNLPNTLFALISAAFVTGYIPMYLRVEKEEGEERANAFTNNILNMMLLAGIIISFVFFFWTEPLLNFLLPSAHPDTMYYYVHFVRIVVFSILGTCFFSLLNGYLHIRNSFIVANLLGIPMSIVVIIFLYLSKIKGYTWIPWGINLGYALQGLLIVLYAYKKGFKYEIHIDFKDQHVKTMLKIALPLIIGTSTTTFGNLIKQAIISGSIGGLATWNYAMRVGSMVSAIFATSIINVTYPAISKSIVEGKLQETKKNFGDSLISMLLFVVPSFVGLVVLAHPIIQLVYMRGEFLVSDVGPTALVLVAFSFSLIPTVTMLLMQRIFYGYQNTRLPMISSILTIAIQVAFSWTLYQFYGVPGATFAVAIASTVGMFYLGYHLRKKFTPFPLRKYARQVLKIVMASAVMGVVAFFGFKGFRLFLSNNISTLLTILLAMGVYLVVILYLRVEAVENLLKSLRNRRG